LATPWKLKFTAPEAATIYLLVAKVLLCHAAGGSFLKLCTITSV